MPSPPGAPPFLRKVEGARDDAYNVGVFSKYEDDTTPQVAELIRNAGASLVALNELDSCNRRHAAYQLKELAAQLGDWSFQFASAFPYAGGAYGNGVVRCVFASAHLDYVGDNSQRDQVEALNDWFKAVYAGAKKPVFLCGDFNAEPDSEAIRLMRQGWTQLSGVDNTYSTKNPRKCIDYVFAYKAAAPVEVISSEVLTTGTESFSDHFPVKVVVKF